MKGDTMAKRKQRNMQKRAKLPRVARKPVQQARGAPHPMQQPSEAHQYAQAATADMAMQDEFDRALYLLTYIEALTRNVHLEGDRDNLPIRIVATDDIDGEYTLHEYDDLPSIYADAMTFFTKKLRHSQDMANTILSNEYFLQAFAQSIDAVA